MVEVCLCRNQKMHLLKLLSVWCSFRKLSSLLSSQTTEQKDLSVILFCCCFFGRNNLFQCSQVYVLLILWQVNYHYSEESLLDFWLLSVYYSYIFIIVFLQFHISIPFLFQIFFTTQYVQQLHRPVNLLWCSSFITTWPSDIYLVIIYFCIFLKKPFPLWNINWSWFWLRTEKVFCSLLEFYHNPKTHESLLKTSCLVKIKAWQSSPQKMQN